MIINLEGAALVFWLSPPFFVTLFNQERKIMEPQKEQAEKQQVMVPINPTALETPSGLVMVWGFEHVSVKMLNMLKTVLSHDGFDMVYHGIKSVVFRVDGYPKENGKSICATFSPDTGSIAINMEKTFEKAIERSMDHPETSLCASWWVEMLLNFGHEAHHGVRWATDRDKLYANEGGLLEKEELLAEKYAESLISELVQEYNIEMPNLEDEVWFNSQTSELLDSKGKDEWAKAQNEMLIEKIIWRHEPKNGEEVVVHTFKEFICLITNGDMTSEEWSKPTSQIDPNIKTLDEQLNGKIIKTNATGEQSEVVQPSPAPAATTPVSSNFANETEDYGDAYEDATEGYEESYYAEPISQPLAQATPPVATTPVATATQFDNMPAQQAAQADTMDMVTINRIAKTVYTKMYDFIFSNCGPLRDSDVGFANPEAVLTTPLLLTPEEASIFVSMDHMDVNGRWCPGVSTKNGLLGKVMKNTRLPSYEVVLSVNGTIHKRLFIPQNPNKRNNGILTQRSLEARSGDTIAYIKNKDTDAWGPYFINGEYKLPRDKQ